MTEAAPERTALTERETFVADRTNRTCIVSVFRSARQSYRDDPEQLDAYAHLAGYHLAAIAMRGPGDPLGAIIGMEAQLLAEELDAEGYRHNVIRSFLEVAQVRAVETVRKQLARG